MHMLPGFVFMSDYAGNFSKSWNGTSVFPSTPSGFSWSEASPKSGFPSSTKTTLITLPLVNQVSSTESPSTSSQSLAIATWPKPSESLTAPRYTSDLSQYTISESSVVMYTSSVVYESYFPPTVRITSLTAVAFESSAVPGRTSSEWQDLLRNVTALKVCILTHLDFLCIGNHHN